VGILEGSKAHELNGTKIKFDGDVILQADNKTVTNSRDFHLQIREKEIGDTINLIILRDDQIKKIGVPIAPHPSSRYENASYYSNTTKTNFFPYESLNLGFEMQYPSNWEITREEARIFFRSQPENPYDPVRENLVISRSDAVENETLSKILTKTRLNPVIDEQRNATILSGNPAAEQVYSYFDDIRGKIKLMNVVTIEGNNAYIITYFAQEPKFDHYLPTIQKMINSFKILGSIPYTNFNVGFEVTYPSSWIFTEDDVEENEMSVLFSQSPEEKNYSRFENEGLNVFSSPSTGMLLNEVVNETIENHKDDLIKFKPVHPYASNFTNLQPSQIINYTYGDPDFGIINSTEIITLQNNKIYHILYRAEKDNFRKHLPIINEMISSFKILNTTLYENAELGIMLQHPSNEWEQVETTDNVKFRFQTNPFMFLFGQILGFSNNHPFFDKYQEDVTLSVSSSDDSLEDTYTRLMTASKEHLRNFREIDAESNKFYVFDTTLDDNVAGHKIVSSYTGKNHEGKPVPFMMVQVYAIFNNKLFNFTFDAELSTYNRFLPTIEEIIESSKIIDLMPVMDLEKPISKAGLTLAYPNDWNFTAEPDAAAFRISSNRTNESDYQEQIFFLIGPSGDVPLEGHVESAVNEMKNYTDFEIIESNLTSFAGKNFAHKMVYSYTDNLQRVKALDIFSIIGNKLYYVSYIAEYDKYLSYKPIFEAIIDTIDVQGERIDKDTAQPGLNLGAPPVDLAVNPITSKLYVAVPEANKVYVIDDTSKNIVSNITVGGYPNAVAINTITNTVYVASPETNHIYVIDGYTNKLEKIIDVSETVGDIAVDTSQISSIGGLVFVALTGNDTVSVIDGSDNKIIDNVKVGKSPWGIAIDSMTNRAYVTNSGADTVSVIDFVSFANGTFSGKVIDNIQVELFPMGIVSDPNTGRLYVANSGSNTVSIVDGSINKQINKITVGLFPQALAINQNKTGVPKVYVGNTGSNTISVIDPKSNTVQNPISVGNVPYDVAINEQTNTVYVANYDSEAVSVVDGTTDDLTLGITFRINPPESGYIDCKTQRISSDIHIKFPVDAKITCSVYAKEGFIFKSWSGDTDSFLTNKPSRGNANPISIEQNTKPTIKVSKFTELGANFDTPVELTIPEGVLVSLYGIMVSVFVGWFVPNIARWINARKQNRHLSEYIAKIDAMPDTVDHANKDEYSKQVNEIKKIKREISEMLTSRKISESHYNILDKRISDFEKRIQST
jgi:YVTN family beta-propeller protein